MRSMNWLQVHSKMTWDSRRLVIKASNNSWTNSSKLLNTSPFSPISLRRQISRRCLWMTFKNRLIRWLSSSAASMVVMSSSLPILSFWLIVFSTNFLSTTRPRKRSSSNCRLSVDTILSVRSRLCSKISTSQRRHWIISKKKTILVNSFKVSSLTFRFSPPDIGPSPKKRKWSYHLSWETSKWLLRTTTPRSSQIGNWSGFMTKALLQYKPLI